MLKRILFLIVFGLFVGTGLQAQYYYFDSGTTTYPYQQGCSENLYVRINTEGHADGARAGRFHLVLDPNRFLYSTSDTVSTLRTSLFSASATTFLNWSSEGSPSWKAGSNKTILQIDRTNSTTDYKGTNGLYGTVLFTPLFDASTYNGDFGMEYLPGPDTTETTLSKAGGVEIINSASQTPRMTGTYEVLQQPCVADTNAPTLSITTITNGSTKVNSMSGISINLNEAAGVNGSNVPYVFTGGAVWTGNPSGVISNQYGIDFDTFSLTISGNGQTKVFTGGMFSDVVGSNLLYSVSGKTWQYNDLNYSVVITGSEIQNYGIEKTIVVTGTVKDRINNSYTLSSFSFNAPVAPILISSSQTPAPGAIFVNLSAPVKLGIQDDWAGVDSGSIVVTLQGINGTVYGPYQFSGSDLNLSGVQGSANQPDWYVNITNHVDFPASGTINVNVYAEDMEGTIDSIGDYSFTTRPACSELQCCDPVMLQLGSGVANYYTGINLSISGGNNPYLSWTPGTNTGYLYCGTSTGGLSMYSGNGNTPGTATFAGFFDGSELVFSGNMVVAYLTGDNGDTILLVRIGDFMVKVYPGARASNLSNLGELRFYDMAKNPVLTGISISSLVNGTGNFTGNVPSGTYYVVYKGQSHLASYLSGVSVVQGNPLTLDFTTGTNLYNTQNKGGAVDDGYQYQIAGDLKNILGVYDFMINGNDIAILTASGFIDAGVPFLAPSDLNVDGSINVSDISIIGINFERTDPFFPTSNLFVW